MGRWVCLAPSLGRRALVVLGEVFRLETCGAADSSYVVFSSRWPDFSFQPDRACPPLFADRASLDAFAEARRLVCGMEKFQAWGYRCGSSVELSSLQRPVQEMRPSLDHADSNAKMAEEGLERALQAVHSNEFEAAKFRDPFRRRFTAAWCYAEARALGSCSDLEVLLSYGLMTGLASCRPAFAGSGSGPQKTELTDLGHRRATGTDLLHATKVMTKSCKPPKSDA